ncbi:hypothetical protein [Streptomyces sp. NPDC008122]|uniref:hypothetical protein n=1 Tax=Streptomyces sp. NPDC008122 TaxID=3364810 RepID=UPI0036E248C4
MRVAAHLAGTAGLVWIAVAFLGEGTAGRRLLLAHLVPYAVTYAVTAVRAARAGGAWAREEWSLHLTALCLAPAFSALTVPVLERTWASTGPRPSSRASASAAARSPTRP